MAGCLDKQLSKVDYFQLSASSTNTLFLRGRPLIQRFSSNSITSNSVYISYTTMDCWVFSFLQPLWFCFVLFHFLCNYSMSNSLHFNVGLIHRCDVFQKFVVAVVCKTVLNK